MKFTIHAALYLLIVSLLQLIAFFDSHANRTKTEWILHFLLTALWLYLILGTSG